MPTTYLITGATGGLGSAVLDTLLKLVPPQDIIATSSRASSEEHFKGLGVQYRLVDFNDADSLTTAFAGVDKLFFVSTPTFDTVRRLQQHGNVISAAKRASVKHVYYSSLAFGGLSDDSKVDVQQAHLATERLLRESGVTFTSVRMGVYADAWPCFVNWYPTDDHQQLHLPSDGKIAYALREELGEGSAKLMVRGGYEKEIVLLTGPRAVSFTEIVPVVNEVTGRHIAAEIVAEEEYVRRNAENDEGEKTEKFFRAWLTLFAGVATGDAATVSPLLSELLGRDALDGKEAMAKLLKENRNYTWHQNYAENHNRT